MLPGRICGVPGILIDVARLLHQRNTGRILTGIDRVTVEYIRHYADRARAVLSLGLLAAAASRADSARLFGKLLEGGYGIGPLGAELIAKAWAWYWIAPGTADSILFNTTTLWMNHPRYATHLRWLGARPVFFIHDLIPISHPEYFRPGEKGLHHDIVRNALGMAHGIIVNSRVTEAALREYAARIGMRCPPTAVAPLAPSVMAARAPGPPPIDKPYFVCVGTIEPRKNHLLLLHLWRQLVERLGDAAPRLYVIGQKGWECENIVDLLERCETLQGYVFEDNACGDAKLAGILHHARALLMPSFAEGYGLPVAEALAAGVPVIASDLPAFREIGGDVPEYADPVDGRGWSELVLEYAREDSARRAAQLERMRGFAPSTWARHFAVVDAFIESLA
jgi:glycosyltransferase involved in cell wall biosynthesis